MRWPRKKPDPDPHGLEEDKQRLAKARADEPRVAWVVEGLKRKQEENRFGPTVHAALSQPMRKRHS